MDALIEKYRRQIVEIAQEHGATKIQLFGSFAADHSTKESDIDLLVEMEGSRSLLDIIAIKYGIEDLTNRNVDVVTRKSLSPYIAEQVIRNAKAI